MTRLEAGYTALNFTDPSHEFFRYQLDGLDCDGVDAGTRQASYTNQSTPGLISVSRNYLFLDQRPGGDRLLLRFTLHAVSSGALGAAAKPGPSRPNRHDRCRSPWVRSGKSFLDGPTSGNRRVTVISPPARSWAGRMVGSRSACLLLLIVMLAPGFGQTAARV